MLKIECTNIRPFSKNTPRLCHSSPDPSPERDQPAHQGDHAPLTAEPLVDLAVGAQILADWLIGFEIPRSMAWTCIGEHPRRS